MPQERRRRKISLQNDYAYCIICPVSPSVIPIQDLSLNKLSSAFEHPPEIRISSNYELSRNNNNNNNNYHGIEVAEEAYLSLETNIGEFRRWSFCNFQTSGIPVSPAVSEATALDFGYNDGYGFKLMGGGDNKRNQGSGSNSSASSSTSLSVISGMISNIPERIRKNSSNSKFDVQSLQRDEDGREQLRKLIVY